MHPGYRHIKALVLLPIITGYILTGKYHSIDSHTTVSTVSVLKVANTNIDHYLQPTIESMDSTSTNDLDRLWNMDHIGIKPNEINVVDRDVLCNFENSIIYSEQDKQYIVALPWKTDTSVLPSNYNLALNQLKSLQRKFLIYDKFYKNYSTVISEQENHGFTE